MLFPGGSMYCTFFYYSPEQSFHYLRFSPYLFRQSAAPVTLLTSSCHLRGSGWCLFYLSLFPWINWHTLFPFLASSQIPCSKSPRTWWDKVDASSGRTRFNQASLSMLPNCAWLMSTRSFITRTTQTNELNRLYARWRVTLFRLKAPKTPMCTHAHHYPPFQIYANKWAMLLHAPHRIVQSFGCLVVTCASALLAPDLIRCHSIRIDGHSKDTSSC